MRIRDTSELRRDDPVALLSPRDRLLHEIAEIEAEYKADRMSFAAYVDRKRRLLRQI